MHIALVEILFGHTNEIVVVILEELIGIRNTHLLEVADLRHIYNIYHSFVGCCNGSLATCRRNFADCEREVVVACPLLLHADCWRRIDAGITYR